MLKRAVSLWAILSLTATSSAHAVVPVVAAVAGGGAAAAGSGAAAAGTGASGAGAAGLLGSSKAAGAAGLIDPKKLSESAGAAAKEGDASWDRLQKRLEDSKKIGRDWLKKANYSLKDTLELLNGIDKILGEPPKPERAPITAAGPQDLEHRRSEIQNLLPVRNEPAPADEPSKSTADPAKRPSEVLRARSKQPAVLLPTPNQTTSKSQ
jgi:hypothetical protein